MPKSVILVIIMYAWPGLLKYVDTTSVIQ